jgi:hypothetical protein
MKIARSETSAVCSGTSHPRHARPWAGHPRFTAVSQTKSWMAGTSPAMTMFGWTNSRNICPASLTRKVEDGGSGSVPKRAWLCLATLDYNL